MVFILLELDACCGFDYFKFYYCFLFFSDDNDVLRVYVGIAVGRVEI